MKNIFVGLLLIGSSSTMARRLHKHHHQHPYHDDMMLQIDTKTVSNNKIDIDSHGIFDKAIAKIEKEENDKTDAINMLKELQEKQILAEKKNSMHAKHLLAAQKEANEMLKSMQSEAQMTAQEKLESIVSDQIKQEDDEKKQKEEEESGLTKGFLAETSKQIKTDAGEIDVTPSTQRDAILHDKVQNVVAPKMAEEALSQALNLKQITEPVQEQISISSIAEMKKNMRNKMAQSVAQTQNTVEVGGGSALEQFDQLKTAKAIIPTEEQTEQSFSVEDQKAEDYAELAKVKAARKKQDAPSLEFQTSLNQEIEQDDTVKKQTLFKKAPVSQQQLDDDMENPIAALTALKHPEIMSKATQYNYDDDMYSHYSGGVSFS